MIKAIFWDNDGVLVDTEKLYFQATKEIMAELGIELSKHVFAETVLKNSNGAWFIAKEKGYTEVEIEIFRKKRNELYSVLLEQNDLVIENIPEILTGLYGKYKMGIVTSSRRDHFLLMHKRTGLLKYFNFYLTAEDYQNYKPHPEPYLKALAKTGVAKDECIIIEDSERGLTSAIAAGIRCIVIPNELTSSSNFNGSYNVLKNADEISLLINSM